MPRGPPWVSCLGSSVGESVFSLNIFLGVCFVIFKYFLSGGLCFKLGGDCFLAEGFLFSPLSGTRYIQLWLPISNYFGLYLAVGIRLSGPVFGSPAVQAGLLVPVQAGAV